MLMMLCVGAASGAHDAGCGCGGAGKKGGAADAHDAGHGCGFWQK